MFDSKIVITVTVISVFIFIDCEVFNTTFKCVKDRYIKGENIDHFEVSSVEII